MPPTGPLVSIITPTYNSSAVIKDTLRSIIQQTYQNWELLLVDDASTDDTRAIVQSFAESDSRITLLRLPRNSGGLPGVPKNHALRKAKGDLVAFVDSDDMWQPGKLEHQVEQFTANDKLVMSYVLYQVLQDGSLDTEVLPAPKNRLRGYCYRQLYYKPVIPNSGVMIRRSTLDEVGPLSEDPRIVEDYDLWLRVAQRGQLDFVPEQPLLVYRVVAGSHSSGVLNPWRRMIALSWKYMPSAGYLAFIRNFIVFSYSILARAVNENELKRNRKSL